DRPHNDRGSAVGPYGETKQRVILSKSRRTDGGTEREAPVESKLAWGPHVNSRAWHRVCIKRVKPTRRAAPAGAGHSNSKSALLRMEGLRETRGRRFGKTLRWMDDLTLGVAGGAPTSLPSVPERR